MIFFFKIGWGVLERWIEVTRTGGLTRQESAMKKKISPFFTFLFVSCGHHGARLACGAQIHGAQIHANSLRKVVVTAAIIVVTITATGKARYTRISISISIFHLKNFKWKIIGFNERLVLYSIGLEHQAVFFLIKKKNLKKNVFLKIKKNRTCLVGRTCQNRTKSQGPNRSFWAI